MRQTQEKETRQTVTKKEVKSENNAQRKKIQPSYAHSDGGQRVDGRHQVGRYERPLHLGQIRNRSKGCRVCHGLVRRHWRHENLVEDVHGAVGGDDGVDDTTGEETVDEFGSLVGAESDDEVLGLELRAK